MLKLLGSVCILSAAFCGFFQQYRQGRMKYRAREDILSALRQMEGAIRLARTPTPRLLVQAAAHCQTAQAADFFLAAARCAAAEEDFGESWRSLCAGLPLEAEERCALGEVGRAFGADEEQLCRAVALSASVLQRCGDEARLRRADEDKRAAAVWLSGGALAVILLI